MTAWLSLLWSLLWAPLWLLVLHPLWRRNKQHGLWVIGGHRGRLYADNASEVERSARARGKTTLFLANRPLVARLFEDGVPAALRNSWRARRAISQAEALIYSHGEDDLDLCALLLRGRTAPRIYLNHSLNFLKAGGVTDPRWNTGGPLVRAVRSFLLTDCDVVLAASEAEAVTLKQAYPMHNVRLGGGAHLDAWQRAGSSPAKRRIYWFPTFRESGAAKAELQRVMSELFYSKGLAAWLQREGYEFFVGTHINRETQGVQTPPSPFVLRSPHQLVQDVAAAELLISDYSGIVFDYLLLGRPQIHFTFDLDDYLSKRALFTSHRDLKFGLQVQTVNELVQALVSGAWRDEALTLAARAERNRCLPPGEEDFASRSVHAISSFLSEKSP